MFFFNWIKSLFQSSEIKNSPEIKKTQDSDGPQIGDIDPETGLELYSRGSFGDPLGIAGGNTYLSPAISKMKQNHAEASKILEQGLCPCCKSYDSMMVGPSGGFTTNIECNQCSAKYNVFDGLILETLYVPSTLPGDLTRH